MHIKRYIDEQIEAGRIRWLFNVPALLGACLLLASFIVSLFWIRDRHLNETTVQRTMEMKRLVDHEIKTHTEILHALLEQISARNDLRTAFLAEDRPRLLALTEPLFKKLQQDYHITHLNFILPDRTVFLRARAPQVYGDRIDRASLLMAAEQHQFTAGIEAGVFGTLTLRTVIPWGLDAETKGFLELGIELEHLLTKLKDVLGVNGIQGMDFIALLKKEALNPYINSLSDSRQERNLDWDVFQNHVIVFQTLSQTPPPLLEAVKKFERDNNEICGIYINKFIYNSRAYRGGVIDLHGLRGEEYGHLIVLLDTTWLEAQFHITRVSIMAISIAMLFLMPLAFLYFLYSGAITKQLTDFRLRLQSKVEEHAQAEKQIREQHVFVQQLLDSIAYPLSVIDPFTYQVLFANHAARVNQFFEGITCHALSHGSPTPCSNHTNHPCPIFAVLHSGTTSVCEHVHIGPDGGDMHVEIHAVPFLDGTGEIKAVIEHCLDITKHKQTEQHLREAKEAAEEASLLKSQFMANMSHEFRTPMNGILGFSDLLIDMGITAEQQEYVTIIQSSARRLLDLINNVLDFSKLEAGKCETANIPFSLADFLSETMKMHAADAYGKGLELAYSISPDVPDGLSGDPGRLRQIFVNLLGNAIKFTKIGQVAVRVSLMNTAIPTIGKTDVIYLRFEVSDSGIGIPLEKQRTIFEAFAQADGSISREFGGTGLGLAICNQLVEFLGGALEVTSTPGKGSTFLFCLPFQPLPEQPPSLEAVARCELEELSVLLVDSNATTLAINKENLTGWVRRVRTAANAEDALVAVGSEFFDAVILDIRSGDMSGFELASRLRSMESRRQTGIILLTAAGLRGDSARCQELGISAYLMKPVGKMELLQAIRKACSRPEALGNELITRHTLREERKAVRILLAEDDYVSRTLATTILEKEGYQVLAVDNGREVLMAMEQSHYDLILLDLRMPEMDGTEAATAIREMESRGAERIPIVALTGSDPELDRYRCIEAGMDDFIKKPVESGAILEAVLKWAGKRTNIHA